MADSAWPSCGGWLREKVVTSTVSSCCAAACVLPGRAVLTPSAATHGPSVPRETESVCVCVCACVCVHLCTTKRSVCMPYEGELIEFSPISWTEAGAIQCTTSTGMAACLLWHAAHTHTAKAHAQHLLSHPREAQGSAAIAHACSTSCSSTSMLWFHS
eukprot:1157626-Pelagomonas_calceolata.AAC.14